MMLSATLFQLLHHFDEKISFSAFTKEEPIKMDVGSYHVNDKRAT